MFIQVRMSATSQEEAENISRTLVEAQLVAGTMISEGNCHYRWEGEVVEKQYFNIRAYSLEGHQDSIVAHVEKIHSDECPVILFSHVSGSQKTLDWITEATRPL